MDNLDKAALIGVTPIILALLFLVPLLFDAPYLELVGGMAVILTSVFATLIVLHKWLDWVYDYMEKKDEGQ
jgi:membrane protein YdbS with pleckstrin-like domain